jgi:hypothetical protein
MKEVVSFFTASAKRNFVLKSVLKGQLLGICDTRWVERHDAVLQFRCSLPEIVKSLTIVSKWEERDSSSKANGLIHAICCSDFILTIFCLCDVLSVTLPLSRLLQTVSLDLQSAATSVADVIAVLEDKRNNCLSLFDTIFDDAEIFIDAAELDVELSLPRLVKKQMNRPNYPATTPKEYYRRAIYLPLLDSITVDLKTRFQSETLDMFELTNLIPSNVVKLSNNADDKLVQHCVSRILNLYSNLLDVSSNRELLHVKLVAELQLWRVKWLRFATDVSCFPQTVCDALVACEKDKVIYPTIHSLLSILLTLPVSVATAERSFSTLRRLKNWLRSRMCEDRLTGLALMTIHREIVMDIDNIIDRYARSRKRLMEFVV